MEVITLANLKGGVLKSSVAQTLSTILGEQGYKVLLIDMDYQQNTTDAMRANDSRSIFDALTGKYKISQTIQPIPYGHMIASSRSMALLDTTLKEKDRTVKLRNLLKEIEDRFDFVIIDTSPSLGLATVNALVAADTVIIPTQADRFSLKGIESLYQTIQTVRKNANPDLKVEGILLTRFDRRSNLARFEENQAKEIAQKIGTKVFDVFIRENVKAREAQALQIPLIDYDQKCNAYQDYKELTKEFLKERV